ncbi:hypothetical protein MHBO_003108 [Bonamia ostreae]|uniref:Uncharacterized protein n=1 Tax=Bonamia ostreae TaxID=126728 RepID=A0ABV2APH2_9EUKA
MIKENNNTKAVTCRKIDFDDKLEEAYKEGKTWRWFAEKCDHNSVEMSPMGDNLSVEIQCEYPPKELIGICADVDERKISKIANKKDDQLDQSSEIGRKNKKERYVIDQIKIKEDKVFSAALNLIEERLVSLQHVQIAKDETELFQMFTKLEEHFRKEFGHVFKEAHSDVKNSKTKLPISNNESKFGISDNPKKLPICNNAKNAKKMGRKNVSSLPKTKDFVTLYSSPGDEVVDLVRRDILYLRYTEKVLFEWIANHLKAKSVQISQQMLEAAPADTPRSYAMLGALQKLAPSQIWIEQAQRWMPLPVRSAFGYFSEQEVKKMRESLRMQDSWRTEAARGTNEENIFSEMDEAHREDFIKKMGGSNKSDVQKEIEKFD